MMTDRSEVAGDKEVPVLIDDFCKRFGDPTYTSKLAKTPLQAYLDQVTVEVQAMDAQKGNGGADMYKELRSHALRSIRPLKTITSLNDYLKFRGGNICAGWTFAAVKFSMASNVDIDQPAITRFMELATEHLSIANDLYSYEKEARAYRTGECPDLLNFVAVVQQLLSLPDEASALEMTYALMLQREQWMYAELRKLEAAGTLDDETWEFLRGMWANLSGNTFFSMTTVRYGGEKSRIAKEGRREEKCGCAVVNGTATSDSGYSDDASSGMLKKVVTKK